jgi:glycosidase
MRWDERLLAELVEVYGSDVGARLAEELIEMAQKNRSAGAEADARLFEDPGAAVLISYGDQVTSPGEAPLATLGNFLRNHVAGLTRGVHVLPFYPWSSDDGFSVEDFFAVDPALGGWEDIRALAGDFYLMVDAVFNHASAKGEWFRKFQNGEPGFEEFFATVEGEPDLSRVVRPRTLPLLTGFSTARGARRVWTTFSADQADLNFRDPFVMKSVCEALLFYLRQGARLVRLDAIGFIWKEPGTTCIHLPQAHALVRAWRALAEGAAPGAMIVTETNVPHADNISYFGDGWNEAHMVYNFALPPLVLHTLRAGDAAALNRWAATLKTPSTKTAFFNFLASHDGIGINPARGILSAAEIECLVDGARAAGGFVSMKSLPEGGEVPYELNVNFFDALAAGVDVETALGRFLAAHAIAFSLAGIPGIYFHSLFGSRGDREGAKRSGIPRRINREKFQLEALEAELGAPESLRMRVFSGLSRLLRVRKTQPAFAPCAAQAIEDFGSSLVAIRRGEGAESVLCLHEISGAAAKVALPGRWRDLLSNELHEGSVRLPALGVVWLTKAL